MRRARIVAAAVVVLVVALGTGAYLWVQAVYVLPGASCGAVGGEISARTRLLTGASGTPRCFLAAARTCAPVGIRVHSPGTEGSTDYVFIVSAGGVPGRCRVTEYSQDEWYLGIGRVRVTGCREASVTGKGVVLSCPNRFGPVLILIPPAVAGPYLQTGSALQERHLLGRKSSKQPASKLGIPIGVTEMYCTMTCPAILLTELANSPAGS